jgi:hypothetical protein
MDTEEAKHAPMRSSIQTKPNKSQQTTKKETKNIYKTLSALLQHAHTTQSSCTPSFTAHFSLYLSLSLSLSLKSQISLCFDGLPDRNFDFHGLVQGEPGNESRSSLIYFSHLIIIRFTSEYFDC